RFEHRGINNPHKGPVLFFGWYLRVTFNETCAVANLNTSCTKQCSGRSWISGCEEDGVTWIGTDFFGQSSQFCFRDVFRHRSGHFAVFFVQNVGQAVCTALLGPFLPGVELATRLVSSPRHHNRTYVVILEDTEGGDFEVFGHIGEIEHETEVWLDSPVFLDRFLVGAAWERRGKHYSDEFPDRHQQLFRQLDDVVLFDE